MAGKIFASSSNATFINHKFASELIVAGKRNYCEPHKISYNLFCSDKPNDSSDLLKCNLFSHV